MSQEIVLITGATGHIGFRTLVLLLEAGYQVRAAVRSQAKIEEILQTKSIHALNSGFNLKFVIVPDLTVDGAYTDAIRGVTYILHLASPMPPASDEPSDYERVVITSSAAALFEAKYLFEEDTPFGTVWNEESRTSIPQGSFPSPFHAYDAGKIAVLAAADEYAADPNTKFGIVTILPSFVLGRNELVTKASDLALGSNGPVMGVVLGKKSDISLVSSTVHVDDVALMHIKALDSIVPAGTYVANSEGYAGTLWQDAARIVAEAFPDAVTKGVLKLDGVQPSLNSASERMMGFKFQRFDEQVKSVVGQYLQLLG
ncbi:NAD(P)-binding protein [Cadophora sp. DSE1049]|nr:NAD(P)-binding protein [Cadophora sp. DSE1049]